MAITTSPRQRLLLQGVFAILLLLIISPFDFIPEGVFGFFGLFDDVLYLLIDIAIFYYLKQREDEKLSAGGEPPLDESKRLD